MAAKSPRLIVSTFTKVSILTLVVLGASGTVVVLAGTLVVVLVVVTVDSVLFWGPKHETMPNVRHRSNESILQKWVIVVIFVVVVDVRLFI